MSADKKYDAAELASITKAITDAARSRSDIPVFPAPAMKLCRDALEARGFDLAERERVAGKYFPIFLASLYSAAIGSRQ